MAANNTDRWTPLGLGDISDDESDDDSSYRSPTNVKDVWFQWMKRHEPETGPWIAAQRSFEKTRTPHSWWTAATGAGKAFIVNVALEESWMDYEVLERFLKKHPYVRQSTLAQGAYKTYAKKPTEHGSPYSYVFHTWGGEVVYSSYSKHEQRGPKRTPTGEIATHAWFQVPPNIMLSATQSKTWWIWL